MITVSIVNQKGGVAKTTTCANLGAALAQRGQRILLIDLDPQANLTLGLRRDWNTLPYTLSDVLLAPDRYPLSGVARRIGDLPLLLAAGHMDVARGEAVLAGQPDGTLRLRHILEPLAQAGTFDWVLIDCPPSLGLLTQNALLASTHLIVPTEPKFYAFAGMDILNRLLIRLAEEYQFEIHLLGVLLTLYEGNTRLHRTIAETIRERFGAKVFQSVIYKNVRLAEAEVDGQPIVLYDPRARSAQNYQALAEEVWERMQPGYQASGAGTATQAVSS